MLRKNWIRLLGILAVSLTLAGQISAETRVLLVGDSWSGGMWRARTLQQVFADNGRADITEEGTETALGGTRASQWRTEGLGLITGELNRLPTVDTVQLTIGGNDVLAGQTGGGFYVGMGAAAESALMERVTADTMAIVDHVLAHAPQMEVIISLYDYPNFVDPVSNGGCSPSFERMGEPTPRQLNDMMHRFNDSIAAAAASRPRAFFIDHLGTMQFLYGFPGEGIAPGMLTPPGDLGRPSPLEAMSNPLDCIHMNPVSYSAVVQSLWDGYYDRRFNGSGGGGGGSAATVRFSSSTVEVQESQSNVTLTAELAQEPTGPVVVDYGAMSGTARSGEDFQATSGTLSWDVGESRSQSFTVRVFQDDIEEGNESFTVALSNPSGNLMIDGGRSSAEVVILDDDGPGFCVPAADVLCLQDGRFRVEVDWRIPDGTVGHGRAQPLSDSSGLFWFFSPDNFEMLLKVLDGCEIPGLEAYWVFFAATTNVEFTARVTDTSTGQIKEYGNPQGQAAEPVQDLTTFLACP
ncbi:MAG: Calx-beta domain-containing protein [Acidobacteriota bacterium]